MGECGRKQPKVNAGVLVYFVLVEQAMGIAPSGEKPWNPTGSVKGEERAFRLGQGEFEELVRHSRRDEKGVQSDIKKLRFKREI